MSRLQKNLRRGLLICVTGGLALGSAAGVADAADPPRKEVTLSDGRTVSRWAYAQTAATVRAAPSFDARPVGRLRYLTEDGQPEPYVALTKAYIPSSRMTWIKVPLAKRPNGVTGWVPVRALGSLQVVHGRLVVDRSRLRATLFDGDGRTIWSARIGVGRRSLPTPAGHFYVREKLRAIGSPVYGPFAIGTSAYAPTLSDWPGGGVVGIHGTDQPGLIPGRPSHGCVRLRNADITRLWHLIAVGTPIDIT
ncbi:MAG: hypothetical protein QOJ46_1406 [bacterium]|jgi:hypothetical protein